ncbi:GNAT family N-acetyltransferase [Microlunatus antarcticus]|uniref:GNAT superfamily N-acetyltransferase n=1 Tax=Microlunatus antarcticus TaxID=53388 RepID=A0A7W5JYW6_9ACTN|nr:GNAT family N-acetyltransferase [Microlunatus antarcticus]MBB3328887.1 GNAT superfamily N-acetyltransferase [Microlunatus antarcticus]
MITARPLERSDLAAVVDLLQAYDRQWFGEPVLGVEDVRSAWEAPAFDLATDSEGWDEDGELVAFGTLGAAAEVELAVRQDWAGAGLEDAVLDRWETEARRRGLDKLRRDLPATDDEGRARLEARGWTVERTGWMLRLDPNTPVQEQDLPDGYAVRPLAEPDVPAAYTVISEAFARYGFRRTYADWRAGTVDRADLTLEHGRIVTWRDEVVGVCLVIDPAPGGGSASDAEAWVPQVAVDEGHRRRGLARELLARTAVAARGRGVPRLALYTNGDTGALGLYERFGMEVRHTLVECSLTL